MPPLYTSMLCPWHTCLHLIFKNFLWRTLLDPFYRWVGWDLGKVKYFAQSTLLLSGRIRTWTQVHLTLKTLTLKKKEKKTLTLNKKQKNKPNTKALPSRKGEKLKPTMTVQDEKSSDSRICKVHSIPKVSPWFRLGILITAFQHIPKVAYELSLNPKWFSNHSKITKSATTYTDLNIPEAKHLRNDHTIGEFQQIANKTG